MVQVEHRGLVEVLVVMVLVEHLVQVVVMVQVEHQVLLVHQGLAEVLVHQVLVEHRVLDFQQLIMQV
jgi:hypothetical protein